VVVVDPVPTAKPPVVSKEDLVATIKIRITSHGNSVVPLLQSRMLPRGSNVSARGASITRDAMTMNLVIMVMSPHGLKTAAVEITVTVLTMETIPPQALPLEVALRGNSKLPRHPQVDKPVMVTGTPDSLRRLRPVLLQLLLGPLPASTLCTTVVLQLLRLRHLVKDLLLL
jgi:hypothetical protein